MDIQCAPDILMASLLRCTQHQVMWNLSSDEIQAMQWSLNLSKIAANMQNAVFLVSGDFTENTIARNPSAVIAINVPTEADLQIGNII